MVASRPQRCAASSEPFTIRPPDTAPPQNRAMALEHAQPLEPIDVRPLGAALATTPSTSLLKSESLQLMRVVLRRGARLPTHSVAGEITVHCLEGEVVLKTPSRELTLRAGELVLLPGGEPHALLAVMDASLLVTLHLAHAGRAPASSDADVSRRGA
jgi:quercetin dioxygenase-like cupin family protein